MRKGGGGDREREGKGTVQETKYVRVCMYVCMGCMYSHMPDKLRE